MALSNYAVACWGDSLTAGAGGDGVTYPQVLAERIAEKYTAVPVHNLGIGGENTVTILGRAGATVIHLYRKIVVPETCTPRARVAELRPRRDVPSAAPGRRRHQPR